MGNIQRNRLIRLGENRNHYLDSNQRISCVIATIFLSVSDKELILDLTRWYKDPLDKSCMDHKEHIGYFRVGTLDKPDKRKIARTLKLNKPDRPFSLNSWEYEPERYCNLNSMLEYSLEKNNNVIRALKISEIKQKLKNG